ncbi:hypothetical protein P7225_20815 [Vibrio parahaemolyticus]|nr:hypothetical protein [Vibrio parahaemolyticus]
MFRETIKFSAFMAALFFCVKVAGILGLIVLIIAVCFYAQWLNGRSASSILNVNDIENKYTTNSLRDTQSWSSSYCYGSNEHPYDPHISSVERTY